MSRSRYTDISKRNLLILILLPIYTSILWVFDIIGWIVFGYSKAAVVVTIVLLLATIYSIIPIIRSDE